MQQWKRLKEILIKMDKIAIYGSGGFGREVYAGTGAKIINQLTIGNKTVIGAIILPTLLQRACS